MAPVHVARPACDNVATCAVSDGRVPMPRDQKPSVRRSTAETWRLPDHLAGPWLRAAHLGRRLRRAKGSIVYRQAEISSFFYFVISGQLRVSILRPGGGETILEFMGRGALCGEGAAFDGLPRFSEATVWRDAELIEFDASRLQEPFRRDPELALSLLRITALKQRVLAAKLAQAYAPSPEGRIGEFLLRLGEIYACPTPHGRQIQVYLTHEQIAAMTGTSRVTVTRTLSRLRRAGAIAVKDGLICVLDSAALVPA
jgi:CRP/FNR family cyclic AMP-dependent transcriptional regulator